MATILYGHDDPILGEPLCRALASEGFDVLVAHSGREVLQLSHSASPVLILLDTDLPDVDYYMVLARLQVSSEVLIVLLSAQGREEDVILGFKRGADDYIAKPVSVPVLISRIKALLHRAKLYAQQQPDGGCIYDMPGAVFDTRRNAVLGHDNTSVTLTATEGRILRLLLENKGRVLPASRILEHIGGYDSESDISVIKVHMMNLRQKIAKLSNSPGLIRTVRGIGYAINTSDDGGVVRMHSGTTRRNPRMTLAVVGQ
jgi:DNA-binding response OmpR family regulator